MPPPTPDIRKIEGEARFIVASTSRKNCAHIVSYHRTSDPNYIQENCSCEAFTIGTPHRIKTGQLANTIENRRCKHLRLVNLILLHHAQQALIASDPSQAGENCAFPARSLEAGLRATE